ncbi:protein SAR DEFICIENT 1-like [Sesbania bispinosa]|nr:protein SAR DEFICIENT 1-like [Sesbania bispinosa]
MFNFVTLSSFLFFISDLCPAISFSSPSFINFRRRELPPSAPLHSSAPSSTFGLPRSLRFGSLRSSFLEPLLFRPICVSVDRRAHWSSRSLLRLSSLRSFLLEPLLFPPICHLRRALLPSTFGSLRSCKLPSIVVSVRPFVSSIVVSDRAVSVAVSVRPSICRL